MRGHKLYDSKAIAGAAHGYQFGSSLTARDFSGGEATVAAKLTELGFEVRRADPDWHYEIGDVATRA